MTDISPLRRVMEETAEKEGLSLKALTVLAPQNDPFRIDSPARHRDGEWLAITAQRLGLGNRTIHLRGLHYMVIGQPKPDGTPYTNTDADWLWLSGDAAKAARWLGYISFEQVVDQCNAAPVTRIWTPPEPRNVVTVGIDIEIPDPDDLTPLIVARDFRGGQPYKLVLFGEKSSLEPILAPVADTYQADLYLPTGEISDTQLHTMARVGAEDGRRVVVFTFSDCDPAGWQMPISIARKLQAFKCGFYPELDFEVHRVALTPDHVREYGLPSTPLKDTEKRGDKWREATGVDQTEIDALAALQPDLLRRIARGALDPFFDRTLAERVRHARREWTEQAQAILDETIGQDRLETIRAEAAEKLAAMQEQIDAFNDELAVDVDDLDLPPHNIPTADLNGNHPLPLVDSDDGFADQCRALIDSKAYLDGGPS
jgi:hypothetical protein